MTELLRLERLSKRYIGTQALDAIDLSVEAGEILCLAGANGSGKSTLLKCISGAEVPDSGQIAWQGRGFRRLTPVQAQQLGIQVIYQDLSIFPDLSVAENIAFHAIQRHHRLWVNWSECRAVASRALEQLGAALPLDARLGDLSIGAKQTAAIARALTQACRLLVMDEPTSALPSRDVAHLLDMVRRLKADGISVLFVSHKLDELFEVADRFCVLRDGRKIGDYRPSELNVEQLGFLMTGITAKAEHAGKVLDGSVEPLLRVEGLARSGQYRDISFSLRPGEVLGLAGLTGAGRSEIALSLFGLNPPDAGRMYMEGRELKARSPLEAARSGIVLVSEDRQSQGLFSRKPIRVNISASVYDRLKSRLGFISTAIERRVADTWVKKVRVKTPSSDDPVQSLSGGNQQKVVLAKWLATEPKVLILDNPTAGIDVGSKMEIHEIIRELAHQGHGVIMISDDLAELAGNCSRVFLLRSGVLSGEFSGAELTARSLGAALRQAA